MPEGGTMILAVGLLLPVSVSRKVVGWSIANHLHTEMGLDALNMAIHNRRPAPGLVHHSDRAS